MTNPFDDLDMTLGEKRKAGLEVIAKILPPQVAGQTRKAAEGKAFGDYMGELALRNVFSEIWARPGLDLRARSLLTLGILIALRATDELRIHIAVALRNGCTVTEIEEAIYHATAYAGFPAANAARAVAAEVVAGLPPEAQ
jgi:4-carboxymuconolactone decarboxylase